MRPKKLVTIVDGEPEAPATDIRPDDEADETPPVGAHWPLTPSPPMEVDKSMPAAVADLAASFEAKVKGDQMLPQPPPRTRRRALTLDRFAVRVAELEGEIAYLVEAVTRWPDGLERASLLLPLADAERGLRRAFEAADGLMAEGWSPPLRKPGEFQVGDMVKLKPAVAADFAIAHPGVDLEAPVTVAGIRGTGRGRKLLVAGLGVVRLSDVKRVRI